MQPKPARLIVGYLTGQGDGDETKELLIAAEEMTDLTTRTDVADWLTASGIGPVDNGRNSDDTTERSQTERASCSWLRDDSQAIEPGLPFGSDPVSPHRRSALSPRGGNYRQVYRHQMTERTKLPAPKVAMSSLLYRKLEQIEDEGIGGNGDPGAWWSPQ